MLIIDLEGYILAKSISLSAYTLRVKNTETDKNEQLDKVDGNSDIIDILNDYFGQIKDKFSKESLLYTDQLHLDLERRVFSGIIQTGDYGYETDLRNIENGKITHTRQKNEAEMLPFYFTIFVPKVVDEGIIIFQRTSNQGIKGSFTKAFGKYFALHNFNHSIEVNPLVPAEVVNQYLSNGEIKKIRLIRYGLHDDITDNYRIQDHKENTYYYYTEYQLCAFRNKRFPIVDPFMKFVASRGNLKGLIEVQDFDYDNIKLEILINKKRRTINLSNLDTIKAYYDITDRIIIGDDGHPKFSSINAVANEYLNDLAAVMYGEDDAQ